MKIDAEKVREAAAWWQETFDDGDEDTPHVHTLLEAAKAWLALHDGMPAKQQVEYVDSQGIKNYDAGAAATNTFINTIKQLAGMK